MPDQSEIKHGTATGSKCCPRNLKKPKRKIIRL